MRKLDAFNHIWPGPFYKAIKSVMGPMRDITRRSEAIPMMVDLDTRFRIMDQFEDYQQISSLAFPPLELAGRPEVGRELARIGNDSMADGAVDEVDVHERRE